MSTIRNFDGPDIRSNVCRECDGRGWTECPDCARCFTCDGERDVECKACDGTTACREVYVDPANGQRWRCDTPVALGEKRCANHERQKLWREKKLLAPREVFRQEAPA